MNKRLVIHNHFPKARDEAGRAVPRAQEDRARADSYARHGISQDGGSSYDPIRAKLSGKALERYDKEEKAHQEKLERERKEFRKRSGFAKDATDMHPDELRDRIKEVTEQIARYGTRLPMTDPLFAKLRGLKAELARATGSGLIRGAKDANQAYKVRVRRLTSGADIITRIFAASQEEAEKRAKERARQMEKIPLDKYREYERAGHAVFRIVSSELDSDQSRPSYDVAKGWEVEFDDKPGKHKITSEADQYVEAVAKRLRLWDGKGEFPGFTLYRDGKEIGGG
jgi:hypothetical protein